VSPRGTFYQKETFDREEHPCLRGGCSEPGGGRGPAFQGIERPAACSGISGGTLGLPGPTGENRGRGTQKVTQSEKGWSARRSVRSTSVRALGSYRTAQRGPRGCVEKNIEFSHFFLTGARPLNHLETLEHSGSGRSGRGAVVTGKQNWTNRGRPGGRGKNQTRRAHGGGEHIRQFGGGPTKGRGKGKHQERVRTISI